MSLYKDVSRIFKAARIEKVLPYQLLLLGGALVSGLRISSLFLCLSSLLLLVISIFIMHINVLTDADLDRDKKPDLIQMLAENLELTIIFLWIEVLLIAIGLVSLVILHQYQLCLSLLTFTLLTTLYSYNFLFPSKSIEDRLKVYWWGHFLTMIGAYLCLWCAGYFCTSGNSLLAFRIWIPVFCFISLSDYSMLLNESAIDAEEEKQADLKTFAALLGTFGSSVLALFLWIASLIGLIAYTVLKVHDYQNVIYTAFIPMICLQGIVIISLLIPWKSDINYQLRLKLPDFSFQISRILMVSVLVWNNYLKGVAL